jgi:RNA polymerase sigma factor (sigma-70 family)
MDRPPEATHLNHIETNERHKSTPPALPWAGSVRRLKAHVCQLGGPRCNVSVMGVSLDDWFAREILVHEEALVRYLSRMWRDHGEVHDLRQEIYIRVYEAAASARPHAAKSFLFSTARHLMIDRVRRGRVVSIEAREDVDALNVLIDEMSPERHATAYEELRALARALERLPPRCREVVWMRRVENLSQREVAVRLGIGEAMVEKHLAKAMRRLADAVFGRAIDEEASVTPTVTATESKGRK